MSNIGFLAAGALACACALPAHAASVALVGAPSQAGYGQWVAFNVDDLSALSGGVEWIDAANTLSPDFGTRLAFTFTLAAGRAGRLTVIDAGFAGDTFVIRDRGNVLGATSAVAGGDFAAAPYVGSDFDAALADTRFSRRTFDFGAGSHSIDGTLDQSVTAGGLPLNATVGALRLITINAVPEPSSGALLLAAVAGLALSCHAGKRGARK